MSVFKYFMKTG